MLVLSVPAWSKLFFDSDYLGGSSLALDSSCFEKEFIAKALLVCFLAYYTLRKVGPQVIFRARMHQSKVALVPYWLPYCGNYAALAKCASKCRADGLGRDVVTTVPDLLKDENGLVPPVVAVNGINGAGVLLLNTCQSVERMLIKNAKCIERSDDAPRLLAGFGGSSVAYAPSSER